MKVTHTYEKICNTFHLIEWENLAATENTIARIIGILKEFVVNIVNVNNVNLIVTKVVWNNSIQDL